MISSKRSKTPTKKKARASSYCSLHQMIVFDMTCGPNGTGNRGAKQGVKMKRRRTGKSRGSNMIKQTQVVPNCSEACLQRPRIEPTMSPFQKRRGSQPAISPEMPSRSPMVCRVLPKCRTPEERAMVFSNSVILEAMKLLGFFGAD